MNPRNRKWLYGLCMLPALLFLVACDDDGGGGTQVVVVTNDVGQVITNTITPPEPQTLYDRTLSAPEGDTVLTDLVTAPDDGVVSATVDWSGGGAVLAWFIRDGAAQGIFNSESPITMSAVTDDGVQWQVAVQNVMSPGAKNINVAIRYAPD